jgi:hypothetical protein
MMIILLELDYEYMDNIVIESAKSIQFIVESLLKKGSYLGKFSLHPVISTLHNMYYVLFTTL